MLGGLARWWLVLTCPLICRALAWEDAEQAAERGAGVLRLLLQPLLDSRTSHGLAAAALAALAALVAAARADRGRAAMAPVLTSGALRLDLELRAEVFNRRP